MRHVGYTLEYSELGDIHDWYTKNGDVGGRQNWMGRLVGFDSRAFWRLIPQSFGVMMSMAV